MRTELKLRRFRLDGRPLENGRFFEERNQEARSWLKHLFDILYVHLNYQQSLPGVNDITSVARTLKSSIDQVGHLQVGSPGGGIYTGYTDYYYQPKDVASQPDSQNVGIVVGTNAGGVTPTQDALLAKVAHGEGAGQLLYGGTELFGLSFVNPNGQFTIRRYFTNILGGAITIQEVGIYSLSFTGDYTAYSFCIARDVVAPGITVNNGEILEATYVPQITV